MRSRCSYRVKANTVLTSGRGNSHHRHSIKGVDKMAQADCNEDGRNVMTATAKLRRRLHKKVVPTAEDMPRHRMNRILNRCQQAELLWAGPEDDHIYNEMDNTSMEDGGYQVTRLKSQGYEGYSDDHQYQLDQRKTMWPTKSNNSQPYVHQPYQDDTEGGYARTTAGQPNALGIKESFSQAPDRFQEQMIPDFDRMTERNGSAPATPRLQPMESLSVEDYNFHPGQDGMAKVCHQLEEYNRHQVNNCGVQSQMPIPCIALCCCCRLAQLQGTGEACCLGLRLAADPKHDHLHAPGTQYHEQGGQSEHRGLFHEESPQYELEHPSTPTHDQRKSYYNQHGSTQHPAGHEHHERGHHKASQVHVHDEAQGHNEPHHSPHMEDGHQWDQSYIQGAHHEEDQPHTHFEEHPGNLHQRQSQMVHRKPANITHHEDGTPRKSQTHIHHGPVHSSHLENSQYRKSHVQQHHETVRLQHHENSQFRKNHIQHAPPTQLENSQYRKSHVQTQFDPMHSPHTEGIQHIKDHVNPQDHINSWQRNSHMQHHEGGGQPRKSHAQHHDSTHSQQLNAAHVTRPNAWESHEDFLSKGFTQDNKDHGDPSCNPKCCLPYLYTSCSLHSDQTKQGYPNHCNYTSNSYSEQYEPSYKSQHFCQGNGQAPCDIAVPAAQTVITCKDACNHCQDFAEDGRPCHRYKNDNLVEDSKSKRIVIQPFTEPQRCSSSTSVVQPTYENGFVIKAYTKYETNGAAGTPKVMQSSYHYTKEAPRPESPWEGRSHLPSSSVCRDYPMLAQKETHDGKRNQMTIRVSARQMPPTLESQQQKNSVIKVNTKRYPS